MALMLLLVYDFLSRSVSRSQKPLSKQNFKENAPTYFRCTRGEFTMIQMDANTRKETRDIGDSLHVISALLYNVSSRSLFLNFFCEPSITLIL